MIKKIISRLEASRQRDIFGGWDTIRIDKAIEIVQEVAKEYGNGWIPCSERLPKADKNRKYLVCGKNGGIYIAEFVCKSVTNVSISPWWSASGRYAPEPIAWMPLPAPYQKGE